MDSLVKAALHIQKRCALAVGAGLASGGALFLVFAPRAIVQSWVGALVGLLLAFSLLGRLADRYRLPQPRRSARLEAEIAAQLVVLSYGLIDLAPGGLVGPCHALAYITVMWAAGFLGRAAALVALLLAIALELGLGVLAHSVAPSVLVTHVVVLVLSGGLNFLVSRVEVARVRQLSKSRIDSELSRVEEAARSYRLTEMRRSAACAIAPAPVPLGDQESLVRSSIDHLQLSLRFMLFLLRGTLGLRTAAIVWCDAPNRKLHLREASSSQPELVAGPFEEQEGVFAAALSSSRPVMLRGVRAEGRMPLYAEPLKSGCVCAVPLLEHGEPLGVLLADTEPGLVLSHASQELLTDAAQYATRAVANERLFLDLERAKTEQGKLYHAADLLAEARTEGQVIQAGVESARQFAHFDFAAVTLFHKSTNTHEICAVSGDIPEDLVGAEFAHNAGLVSMVVSNRHPLPYRGVYHRSKHIVFDEGLKIPAMPSLIVLPLCVHDTPLGTLILGSDSANAFGEQLRPTLEVLARHVAVSLANARMVKRLEDLATTDGMTGLLNKRALTEVARQKLRSAQRFKKPLSLIVGDIDYFKKVNDTYGHDIGDVVIKGFGDVLRRTKRETDAVGRFGGEEFVVACEETDAEGARQLAERIRQELAATTFHSPQGSLNVTCSLGVATFPAAGADWESLFKATDEALYASKRGGRDCVSVWTDTMRGAAA